MRQLTEAEREAIAASEAQGIDFVQVTPEMLFSAKADGALSQKVHSLRPDRYYALKQEWLYQSGQERRPLEYWHQK